MYDYRFRLFQSRLSVWLLAFAFPALAVLVPAWAWSQEIEWYKAIGNDAQRVTVDDKGIYVSGRKCYSWSRCDGVVEAYGYFGGRRWRRQFRIYGNTEAFGLAVHRTGIYVAGRTEDLVGEDSRGPAGFVRKYDLRGNLVWTFLNSEPMREGWDVAVDDTGVYFTGSTRVGPSPVVVGRLDFSGHEVWLRALPDSEGGVPPIALHDGMIYTTSREGDFGTQLWSLDQQGNLMSQSSLPDNLGGSLGRLAVDNSGIYVANWTGLIAKLDLGGVEIWRHQIPWGSLASSGVLAVDSGRVYFGARSSDSNIDLREFDAQGRELWRRQWVDGRPEGLAARRGRLYAAGFSGARHSSSGGLLVALNRALHYRWLNELDIQKEAGATVDGRSACGPSQWTTFTFPVRVVSQTTEPVRGLQFSVRELVGRTDTLLAGSDWAHTNSRFFVPLVGDYADGVLSAGESVEVPMTVCQDGHQWFRLKLDLFGMSDRDQATD